MKNQIKFCLLTTFLLTINSTLNAQAFTFVRKSDSVKISTPSDKQIYSYQQGTLGANVTGNVTGFIQYTATAESSNDYGSYGISISNGSFKHGTANFVNTIFDNADPSINFTTFALSSNQSTVTHSIKVKANALSFQTFAGDYFSSIGEITLTATKSGSFPPINQFFSFEPQTKLVNWSVKEEEKVIPEPSTIAGSIVGFTSFILIFYKNVFCKKDVV